MSSFYLIFCFAQKFYVIGSVYVNMSKPYSKLYSKTKMGCALCSNPINWAFTLLDFNIKVGLVFSYT